MLFFFNVVVAERQKADILDSRERVGKEAAPGSEESAVAVGGRVHVNTNTQTKHVDKMALYLKNKQTVLLIVFVMA